MNWWQTLIVAVVPVLLTLFITNVAESRRRKADAEERKEDRAADEAARVALRREALEDHWRNERFAAHRTFFELALNAREALVLFKIGLTVRSEDERAEWVETQEDDYGEIRNELAEAHARVALLGSGESAKHARAAHAALSPILIRIDLGLGAKAIEPDAIDKSTADAQDALVSYRKAVRLELGTS